MASAISAKVSTGISESQVQKPAELEGQSAPKRKRTDEGPGQRPGPEQGQGQKLQDVNIPQTTQVGNFLNTPDNFTGVKLESFKKNGEKFLVQIGYIQ